MAKIAPKTLYLVDESPIERAHDDIICNDKSLQLDVKFINCALDVISRTPIEREHRGLDELAIFRLMVRCFNSSASSLKALRCGYFQPSFALIRDVMETTFLLDLFLRDRGKVEEWRTLPPKDREKRFKPVEVRKMLDQLDRYTEKRREKAYRLFSSYAAHPTPEGNSIISPEGLTKVGPFPDKRLLKAGLTELAKYIGHAAAIVDGYMEEGGAELLVSKSRLRAVWQEWSKTNMTGTS